ncbi:MAG: hypothetical protein RJB13_223 [Pseudomonadota bacterium]|jgi:hypothetical protein
MPRDPKSANEQTWLSREDLQDIAKIGGDLLKRTVTSGLDVIKDVTDTLPKDASQILQKSREEVLKGLSKEFAQNIVTLAVEKVFATVRDHRLDISIRVRKATESNSESGASEQAGQQSDGNKKPQHTGHTKAAERSSQPTRKSHPHRHR